MVTNSEQEIMLQARSLIQQKKYEEARTILVPLNNPRAREWVVKIDALLDEDPFRSILPSPESQPSYRASLLQPAIATMTQYNWDPIGVFPSGASFRKRNGPDIMLSLLLIVVFSLIGSALVCAMISSAKYHTASFSENQDGTLTANTSFGHFILHNQDHVLYVAKQAQHSITYTQAIVAGIGTAILWSLLMPFIF